MTVPNHTFNLLIVGDKSVGKSALIHRYLTCDFKSDYAPTTSCVMKKLSFFTTHGNVVFNVFDGGYPGDVDCAIIMFDLSNKQSFDHVLTYYNWLHALFGPVSIVVCGSKSDSENRKVSPELISNFLREVPENLIYFDISSKSNYNFDKPFLYILRQLLTTGDKSYGELMNSPINFS